MQKERLIKIINSSRRYIGLAVIALTFSVFTWYLKTHPDALQPIKEIPIYLIPVLILFYGVFLLTNFLITVITISISGMRYPYKDSFMLTIYSTLVNFFGPLQSGPGFRAIYLKKKIGLSIKDYTLATMLYYGAFLAISIVMMFGFSYPLFTSLVLIAFTIAGWLFFRKQQTAELIKGALLIGLVTSLQLLIVAIIYYLELRATGHAPSIPATLTYTGSANLALFVAFTPGAIGIRESFILFSQSLHDIPTNHIISASLLDRSVYVIFLGTLFLLSSSLHISKRFKTKSVME